MCFIEQLQVPIWNAHFMASYTSTIWTIGLFVLLYWMFELLFIRNIFRCSSKRFKKWMKSLLACEPPTTCCNLKLPIAFLMILLSTLTSLLSSTLFLHSSHNASNVTCSYSPIAAILFRFLSKHFIWGFNIVRGQMVIEMLQNKYLNLFVKHSPYILTIQMIAISILVLIFHSCTYDTENSQCSTRIPLILLILTAFIGEFIYGVGFVYIFVKSMTTSMQRVMISVRNKQQQKTKKQLIHHLTVYLIQFILSSFYIINIATCSNQNTFTNFQIFAAELLISNICVLTLFRGRIRRFKKQCICAFCCRSYNEKQLLKYVNSTSVITDPNQRRPVLLPTVSRVGCINQTMPTKKEDILADLPQLELSHIAKPIATATNASISPVSPPIWSRNNSISINPLLPNSWLSPSSIETFRTSLAPINRKINGMSDRNMDEYISRSAPMSYKKNTGNRHVQSLSASAIDIKRTLTEMEMKETASKSLRVEVLAMCDRNVNKSNSFISSNASKSLFKRATLLFTRSHSTPLAGLVTTEAIPAMLSLEDTFKFSNIATAENKESDNSLEIIYSDDGVI